MSAAAMFAVKKGKNCHFITLNPGVPGLVVVVLPNALRAAGEFPDLAVVVLPKINFDFFSAGFSI